MESLAGMNTIQPAVARVRTFPPEFPSALTPGRTTAKLLCLNAAYSDVPLTETVSTVRLVALDRDNRPAGIGEAPIENDGSFYIEVPADRPMRIELVGTSGNLLRAEHDWIWLRPGEQRVCIGCHAGPERAPENRAPAVLFRGAKATKLLGVGPFAR